MLEHTDDPSPSIPPVSTVISAMLKSISSPKSIPDSVKAPGSPQSI